VICKLQQPDLYRSPNCTKAPRARGNSFVSTKGRFRRKYHRASGFSKPSITLARNLPRGHPSGVSSGPMAIPAALRRKRGNPNWGRPTPPAPALPTEFELRARQLQLTPKVYASSRELRIWCEQNRNRCYVPEWLLKEWGITVDLGFSDAA
jgi:hypothetical protein